VNFGTPVPLLIGILLILGAVALFFLDKLKPGYGRDADKVYAILWLISGVFLLGHLNMELLASFQQLLMAGMLIAVTIENVTTRIPKDNRYSPPGVPETPERDYYRPSRAPRDYRSGPRMNVRAEIDHEDAYRPRFPEDRRMLSGRREVPQQRSDYYGGYDAPYGDARGYASERPTERLNPSGDDRLRRRRPKSVDGRYGNNLDDRGWDDTAGGYAANSGGYSANSDTSSASAGGYSAHSASASDSYSRDDSASGYPSRRNSSDDNYIDYRPVNYPEDESTSSTSDYGNRY
jgi:hypothetical protein